MSDSRVLVISMGPYRFSTRTRKASIAYITMGNVTFLGLEGVGRTGKWDKSGSWDADGVHVVQVPVHLPSTTPGLTSQIINVLRSYAPAMVRMLWEVWRRPADVVHVTGVPLVLLGLLHKTWHHSRFVFDVNERPASVMARGSLFATFTRIEPFLLRWAARHADVTTVVAPGHQEILQSVYGFTDVMVVRNSPLSAWRAPFMAPPVKKPAGALQVVTVGTLFEGRALEMLVEAVALASGRGVHVLLDIYGNGRSEYEETLRLLIDRHGVGDQVTLRGQLGGREVSAAYLTGHVGLALYEADDSGNDSLSNKILECVSSGRPVLAGDLPENRRFVSSYDVGWLTPVTSQGIAESFIALAHEEDFDARSRRCRTVGDRELSWEAEFAKVVITLSEPKTRLAQAT